MNMMKMKKIHYKNRRMMKIIKMMMINNLIISIKLEKKECYLELGNQFLIKNLILYKSLIYRN
jgi:hypothetical protein